MFCFSVTYIAIVLLIIFLIDDSMLPLLHSEDFWRLGMRREFKSSFLVLLQPCDWEYNLLTFKSLFWACRSFSSINHCGKGMWKPLSFLSALNRPRLQLYDGDFHTSLWLVAATLIVWAEIQCIFKIPSRPRPRRFSILG